MNAKLGDWGFEFIKEKVRSGGMLMAPEYSSPEALRQERLTPKTDVYGFSILLNQ